MKTNTSSGHLSRLFCPFKISDFDLVFSLIDYRNSYFSSNDQKKILEFYNSFKDKNQLITWMKERPKGTSEIFEIDGSKEIIVVIPTADFFGEFAIRCREEIFKGLHIIYVQSGGRDDYYFNYAHNCNRGIMKAIEYSPKWVVLSNDDMYKMDDVNILISELSGLDDREVEVVFPTATEYHSYLARFGKSKVTRHMFFILLGRLRFIQVLLERRFEVMEFVSMKNGIYDFFFENGRPLLMIGNFGIFSSKYINYLNCKLFDENFINGGEDLDLSVRIMKENRRFSHIKYKIGDYFGSTLGKNTPEGLKNLLGTIRRLRDVANLSYFNCKNQ